MKIDIASLRGLDAHRSADAELATRLEELNAEADGQPFNADQRAEFAQILEDRETLAGIIEELQVREDAVAQALGTTRATERFAIPAIHSKPAAEDIFDVAAYRKRASSVEDLPALLADGAKRVIDGMEFPNIDRAKGQAQIAALLAKHRDDKFEGTDIAHGKVAQRIIGTSSPLYHEAYAAAMSGRPLNPRMQAALQTYSDADGGYALPVTIDPSFILTDDGSANPMREISRVETITTKSWSPVTTDGVSASYVGERTTTGASDSAPSDIANPEVTPVRADVAIDVTLEYLQDYGSARLIAEVGRMVARAKDNLEADKFVVGAGTTGIPEGVVTGVDAVSGSVVTTITNDTFALADLDKVINALGPAFRSTAVAKFLGNLAIYQAARAFATAAQPGNSVYDDVSKILRGYPAREASAMASSVADGAKILIFGDFKTGFVIVDRLGVTSKVIDTVDGSGRPTGGSSLYFAWRNTSKVIAANALRELKVQ